MTLKIISAIGQLLALLAVMGVIAVAFGILFGGF